MKNHKEKIIKKSIFIEVITYKKVLRKVKKDKLFYRRYNRFYLKNLNKYYIKYPSNYEEKLMNDYVKNEELKLYKKNKNNIRTNELKSKIIEKKYRGLYIDKQLYLITGKKIKLKDTDNIIKVYDGIPVWSNDKLNSLYDNN